MSRPAQKGAGAVPPSPASRLVKDGDICPVCKSSRYLNPNMRFLVNPECYHKMCESCVDRIFSHGPAPCPVAGCHRTLRKQKFRKQTFDDIQVEREVDIRRRIAAVFNRTEGDFDTLLDYNNYLNDVEDITSNLIHRVDVEAMERKISAYVDAHQGEIAQNLSRERQAAVSQESRLALEREQAQRRREDAAREDEEERRARDAGRRDVIDKLASGEGNAREIVKDSRRVSLKKSGTRRDGVGGDRGGRATGDKQREEGGGGGDGGGAGGGIVFKGLKKKEAPRAEEPYDAYGGIMLERKYCKVQEGYEWKWLDEARTELRYTVGGYNLQDYYARALSDAFAGLGVFVADEVS